MKKDVHSSGEEQVTWLARVLVMAHDRASGAAKKRRRSSRQPGEPSSEVAHRARLLLDSSSKDPPSEAFRMLESGLAMIEQGRLLEARTACRKAVTSRSGPQDDPAVLLANSALIAIAGTLAEQKRYEEALTTLDEAHESFAHDTDVDADRLRAAADASRGYVLLMMQRDEDAIVAFDRSIVTGDVVIERAIGARTALSAEDDASRADLKDTETSAKTRLALVLLLRAAAQLSLGKRDDSLRSLDQIVARYLYDPDLTGEDASPVANALLSRAHMSLAAGKLKDAKADLKLLISTYKGDSTLTPMVHEARRLLWLLREQQFDAEVSGPFMKEVMKQGGPNAFLAKYTAEWQNARKR